jgi:hypothetical protein
MDNQSKDKPHIFQQENYYLLESVVVTAHTNTDTRTASQESSTSLSSPFSLLSITWTLIA